MKHAHHNQYAHLLRLQTIIPEGSAKHFWNAPQNKWQMAWQPDMENVTHWMSLAPKTHLLDCMPQDHPMSERQ